MSYDPFGYYGAPTAFWHPKRGPFNPSQVVESPTCPDQRKLRRLTRAERIVYLSRKIS